MRDVVIVGGGLSGLAAAATLQQHNVDYTLIEVKRRLGGSLQTVEQDGFVVDTGAFAIAGTSDADWLAELDLTNDVYALKPHVMAFKQGVQTLIDRLASRIHGPRMMRMAVSSIGDIEAPQMPDGRQLALCLENGLVLDARAIIVAVPARYAERMFYSYLPDISKHLQQYHYDQLLRVALGYHTADLPEKIKMPRSMAYVYQHRTTHITRTPPDHTLLQIGLRLDAALCTPAEALDCLLRDLELPPPIMQRVDFWPEADSLSYHHDDHAQTMQAIQSALPPHVALIGSDYSLTTPMRQGVAHLEGRIRQGQQAALQMVEFLQVP